MSQPTSLPADHSPAESLPVLTKDPAFRGMISTQFLGAFNDNVFKQLVLLICVDAIAQTGTDHQATAQAMFAIPFVLFSGLAGFIGDRVSKRGIVVSAKVAEIGIMLLGMTAFFLSGLFPTLLLPLLFLVLFLMGTQSAFFGPSKYGILPELFSKRDLPQANGLIQMTTFVAIILGMAAAGYGKDWFPDSLWIVSAFCVGIAFLGTLTSFWIRKTPIAHPGLEFQWSALGINRETWRMLKADKTLMTVLLISSLFWFVGGVVLPATNTFGKTQLGLSNGDTSLLAACMGIGIAVGCAVTGKLSHQTIRFGLVRVGAWGLTASLGGLWFLGWVHGADPQTFWAKVFPQSSIETWSRLVMLLVGFFGGVFIVPLQVFMQARPPEDQKGRMIGSMNLVNWIAICFASVFLSLSALLFTKLNLGVSWNFGALAIILLPVAIFYRPPDVDLTVYSYVDLAVPLDD